MEGATRRRFRRHRLVSTAVTIAAIGLAGAACSPAGGSDGTVPVGSGPVAVVVANPTTGEVPLDVQFDGSGSYDRDGATIVSYQWDFGDDAGNSGPTLTRPTERYDFGATFDVTLTVTDSNGLTDTAHVSVTATVPPG
jgi:PKD repeat protein